MTTIDNSVLTERLALRGISAPELWLTGHHFERANRWGGRGAQEEKRSCDIDVKIAGNFWPESDNNRRTRCPGPGFPNNPGGRVADTLTAGNPAEWFQALHVTAESALHRTLPSAARRLGWVKR
jgi:hypothetical protein